DGFVLRYPTSGDDAGVDGLEGDEGAFLACSFWLADDLAMIGRVDEARKLFGKLLSLRNDLGLLAEEWDPHLQRQLGNFPQAFSHSGLVTTAFLLERLGAGRPQVAPARAIGQPCPPAGGPARTASVVLPSDSAAGRGL
ncbi:glycoside hydrolase family 15 protein, partial [Streptomyces sp. NPDC057654]|uniref:glycoside hydrolase family 15 protein n=1 Tax=Streptomyces sp. NPDC057654 TaxID=3346196 RepID=UPI0036B52AFE